MIRFQTVGVIIRNFGLKPFVCNPKRLITNSGCSS